jgi:catechol 2,3-dioxygenase-like lactoylglutathione lyase family enzyme
MLDHLSIGATRIEDSARFYDAVLAPLGYVRAWSDLRPGEHGQAVGYGYPRGDDKFCIKQVAPGGPFASPGFHIAFAADSQGQVEAFYRAAMEAGATDNGQPGLRPHYGANYYAAFVCDPDGHRIEAVCHGAA